MATVCFFSGQPLSAQRAAPSLQQVLQEGMVASKALAKREKTAKDTSFDGYVTRGLMTFALLASGQRQLVDDLIFDPAERRKIIEISAGLLVEVTGKIPAIKPGTAPLEEAVQRQTITISLAKRGDFKAALEQIAAYPEHERVAPLVVRAYQLVVDKQLDKPDLDGARQTNRLLWSSINKLKDSGRKVERLIDLARSTSRAGEKGPAQKICLMAENMLKQLPAAEKAEAQDVIYSLRRLAVAHAMSGNIDRARAVLADYKQRVEALEEPRDKADRMSEMEIAHARVAVLANEKEIALQAYARALEWAMKINQNAAVGQADALDESRFLSSLIALGTGATFRTVALGQLEAGDKQAALATLKRMPMCLQKPATLLEMAKMLHKKGATGEARQLAEQCAALYQPKAPLEDLVAITAFVANIHRAIGGNEAARQTMKKLAVNPRLKQSIAARKRAAAELTDFQLFAESYNLAQTLESPADRALPLAYLAERMVKAGHK